MLLSSRKTDSFVGVCRTDSLAYFVGKQDLYDMNSRPIVTLEIRSIPQGLP